MLGLLGIAKRDLLVTVFKAEWEDVRIRIRYELDRLTDGEFAHLIVESVKKEPLPISGSGHRYYWVAVHVVEAHGGPVALVMKWLEEARRPPA